MALSEHDRRILDDLERSWQESGWSPVIRRTINRNRAWSTAVGLAGGLAGLALVLAGLRCDSAPGTLLGICGYLVMVAAVDLLVHVLAIGFRRRRGRR
jgi:hypothetical protein